MWAGSRLTFITFIHSFNQCVLDISSIYEGAGAGKKRGGAQQKWRYNSKAGGSEKGLLWRH